MAQAGNDPGQSLLRLLEGSRRTSGFPDTGGGRSATAATAPEEADFEIDSSLLEDPDQWANALLTLFAQLVDRCRRADLNRAGRTLATIEKVAASTAPEVIGLARSFVAETQGRFRQAEQDLTECLSQPHTHEDVTRPIALVERATHRMRLGLLDGALADLARAREYGPSILSLHSLAVEALIHWWRSDQPAVQHALDQCPRHLVKGVDLGVGWYALAMELAENGPVYADDVGRHNDAAARDCLAREFWEARPNNVAPAYLMTLGPHMMRHEVGLGHDSGPLLDEVVAAAPPDTAAGQAYRWCQAIARGDSFALTEMGDRFRDDGVMLFAIDAYRDAAACSPDDEQRERLRRRSQLIYDELSRAVNTDPGDVLPPSLARVLTSAEQSVVAAVVQGLSNNEVAGELNCSVRTVESHLTSTYRKLGIKRRTQLAAIVAQSADGERFTNS